MALRKLSGGAWDCAKADVPYTPAENDYTICVAVPGLCDAGESYPGPDSHREN